jgi:DNA-binding SARP family transcriptional activator
MLQVRVLGELTIELDGQPLALPSRRPARVLLGWLALHPGMHHRAKVAARLWPNVRDDSARVSLRSALAALRAALGPAAERALIATRADVGLADQPEVSVDVREFERRLSAGQADAALALCGGELLAEFDDDWVLAARDQHRAREGEALGMLAGDAAAAGDHQTAIALARRRTALDPFDESAHRELIGLLLAAGDRAAALASYRRLADRLSRELGVAPSPATRRLLAVPPKPVAIPERTKPSTPQPLPARVLAAARSGPLLGRKRELAQLHEVWARGGPNSRRMALVTGEPGIGKTRLVSEFAAGLDRAATSVLYGAAREEPLVPYEPLVDCLREPLRDPPALPEEAAALAGLIPELTPVGDHGHQIGEPAPDARLRLFDAFGQTLDAIAGHRPLLLILEDLHWAEAPTIRLLVHLATREGRTPRVLVVTYRDTEVEHRHPLAAGLAALHRALPGAQITLDGIETDAVAAMLGRGPAGGLSSDAAPAVRERTGGNPFFIEQLVRSPAQVASGLAPTSVGHVVARRVAALGERAQQILQAAAVAGTEFELSLLSAALDRPAEAVLDVLDAAGRARLVAELPGQPGGYAFVHAIVRDTLAGALTAGRRAHIHDLLAQVLEQRADTDPDRYLLAAARHALEATAGPSDPERAAVLAERAAERAGAVLAHEDAAELLRRAVLALERLGGSPGRRAELIARAALVRAGAGVTILGADAELVTELEQALDTLGPAHPQLRARLLARLAIELAYEPDSTRRESLSAEALQLAARIDDPVALAAALNARHVALWGPDHSRQRKELADEMLELAERAGDRELALQARHWRIIDLFELGEGHAVRDELDTYAALAAELRLPVHSWYVPLWRATIALLEGRLAEGAELARRARELGRRAGDRNADVFFAEQQLLRHLVTGTLGDLEPQAAGMQGEVAERSQRGPAWRAYQFTFAWWHAERGEAEQARRDFEAAFADGFGSLPRDVNWLDTLGAAANAAVLLGDIERCTELRVLLEPYAERMIVNARGALHVGSVAYVLARLAAACGDDAAADRLFRDAAQRDEQAGAPAWVSRDIRHHRELARYVGRASAVVAPTVREDRL